MIMKTRKLIIGRGYSMTLGISVCVCVDGTLVARMRCCKAFGI